jgi:hypothetical protein
MIERLKLNDHSCKGERVMRFHLILSVTFFVMSASTLYSQTGEAAETEKPKLGTFNGRFLYDGEPPEVKPIGRFHEITLDEPLRRESGTRRRSSVASFYRNYLRQGIRPNTNDESLLVSKEGGIANVVVFVRSKDIPLPALNTGTLPPVKLQFKDGQFVPRILGIRTNQTLIVENCDKFVFNFHTYPYRNGADNRLIKPKTEQRFTFQNSERFPVRFQSDMQTWAKGILVIRDNPYFALSDADGKWNIPDLPLGKWEFQTWHEKAGRLTNWKNGRFTFDIKTGKNDLGTIKLSPEMFKKD